MPQFKSFLAIATCGLALLAASPAQVVAQAREQVSLGQPVALIPSTEREDLSVPESKREMIAYLSVPEVAPRAVKKIVPEYPEFARQARLRGMVYARLLVDENGKVVQIGQIKGHGAFRQAVKEVVGRWEFTPARQGDQPVKAWVTVPFSFEL